MICLVWQAGTVAWIGGGVLLIAAPWMASEPARHWIVLEPPRGVWLPPPWQRSPHPRPPFWLDGSRRGRRTGGRRLLAGGLINAQSEPHFAVIHRNSLE